MHSVAYFFYAAPRAGTAGKQAMPIEGIDYRLVFASDVNPRDGLGLECWRGEQPLFEVFRDDAGRRFVVNLFASDVPLTARRELGDFPRRSASRGVAKPG
ncbi:hypothetical protein OLM94_19050 [Pseudomonas aeruginosa]|uniref:hypothetical protein n=1 Tax=Pseudomonas aeruginosa TaxID=287 RepID=UPI00249673E7|nr:hypothetical protein [Pseudomonas aeruginosa]MDI2535480.1 hypothetical protein [Pseudomonas aeruginosa]